MNQDQFLALKKQAQKQRFETAADRLMVLKKLKKWISKNETLILEALHKDFSKPHFETHLTELLPALGEINFFIKNLSTWMKDQKVPTPVSLFGHRSKIRFENKGVVLIISPWNYPFNLTVLPLVAALAAGNTVVIKPSETTSATSNIMLQMIQECFSPNQVLLFLGGKNVTEQLLTFHFDHVFFTGSTAVGRLIAKACAERLIPVTLELGGKSPTLIDSTADLSVAAAKIFWGKFLNRGQTCVAPDYILIHESKVGEFKTQMQLLNQKHSLSIEGRIINAHHEKRLQRIAGSPVPFSQQAVELCEISDFENFFRQEEIFGPVLPVLTFKDFLDLEKIIRRFESPLSFYIFSKSKPFIEQVLKTFPSGGVGINAVLLQLSNPHLPFGGIGASGLGKYHGHYGFVEFSHQRGIIESYAFHAATRFVLPPYTPVKSKLLTFLKYFL